MRFTFGMIFLVLRRGHLRRFNGSQKYYRLNNTPFFKDIRLHSTLSTVAIKDKKILEVIEAVLWIRIRIQIRTGYGFNGVPGSVSGS